MKADKNPSTSNPLITVEANKIRKALITKVKSPRVIILIGRVIITRIGLIIILIIAKNKAKHIAVQRPATNTPGIK